MKKLFGVAGFLLFLAAFSLAQNTAGSPSDSKLPITICDPHGDSPAGCLFPCNSRRRPQESACIVPPKPTYFPIAEYSDKARRKRIQGVVELQITIAADGRVSDVKVTRSLEPSLDKQAVDAVKKWRFDPATVDGKPVPVSVASETSFRLR